MAKVKDPVCGMMVDTESAVKHVYKGNVYYFCCEHCLATFKANPEKYIKVSE